HWESVGCSQLCFPRDKTSNNSSSSNPLLQAARRVERSGFRTGGVSGVAVVTQTPSVVTARKGVTTSMDCDVSTDDGSRCINRFPEEPLDLC
ncbi:hypothetical protein JOB18_009484, partial [Solea senegalensis]